MEAGVVEATVGGGCGSTAGGVHGLQVAQQVLDGGDQSYSTGAMGSDNSDAGGQGRCQGRGR